MIKYKRVLIKLSGGAFAGAANFGFDRAALDNIGNDILAVRDLGIEIAVMVGGGNIFRGRTADDWGIERAEAGNIGTMATVINSLILRGILTAKGIPNVRVMTAVPTPYVTTDSPSVQRAVEMRAEVILAAKQTGGLTMPSRRVKAIVGCLAIWVLSVALSRSIRTCCRSLRRRLIGGGTKSPTSNKRARTTAPDACSGLFCASRTSQPGAALAALLHSRVHGLTSSNRM